MSGMGQNLEVKWQYKSTGIPDNLFSRSKAGLTREEIRLIIASKTRIKGNEGILDVGTGSGSVSIEFARLCCEEEHGKIWVER